jgi:dipeptidyl-peptidase 4
MRYILRVLPLFCFPLFAAAQTKDTVDYHKADLIRVSGAYVLGTSVSPNWLEDSVRFWYKSTGKGDRTVVYLVDPRSASRRILFDNARMAAALSLAADTILDPTRLPRFAIVDTGKTLEVQFRKKVFRCATGSYACQSVDSLQWASEKEIKDGPPWAARSPDKKWDVFSYHYNLYVRPADAWTADVRAKRDSILRARSQKDSAKPKSAPKKDSVGLPAGSIQLTSDGVKAWSYGLGDWFWNLFGNEPKPWQPLRVAAVWAPDSKKFAISRTDSRGVRTYPMYSSTGDQPIDKSYNWAAPGDSIIPLMSVYVIDVADKRVTRVQDSASAALNFNPAPAWSRTSDRVFMLNTNRGYKRMHVAVADATTGTAKTVVRDTVNTWAELKFQIVNGGEDVLALSERDGWQHIYRFSADGSLKNQVESGAYRVNSISRVDSVAKQIYFVAQGKEAGVMPYYARLYRINFDGTGLTMLTPEEGTHAATWVPKAPYFIDTYSAVDKVPITVVRSAANGQMVMELARGDAELLKQVGWTSGELFTVKARDGVTDIWGIMYKPSDFDPKKVYPILSNIYPGPQTGSVRSWGFGSPDEARAIAELGFIVIQLNHMGTPGRSKSFNDYYYGRMSDNGLPDHVAGIRQLAARYPWIDINRVGIYGTSGGGFATADAMFRYPDFFKVGVSDSGNHDQRTYHYAWGETYQGLLKKTGGKDNFEDEANYTVAKNLKGHLLLLAGDLDANVHPAATLRVVDALIKANKANFDLLITPDGGHGAGDYGMRRRWDYFVRYLLGKTPPADYEMLKPVRPE